MDIDKFISDYIAAALWSSIDDNDEPLDSNYSIDDISEECLLKMKIDCKKFVLDNIGILTESDHPGHDFWLTRNGHGAGFWDGDYPIHGNTLTTSSVDYGPTDLYVGDDGLIYCT